MRRLVALSGLAAIAAAAVSACGSDSSTSASQTSTTQTQGNGGSSSSSSQGGGAGNLTVSGARNATLVVKLNGNECDSGKGGVSTSGSLSATFDWGNITAATTTSFPGQKDPRTGGVTAGAYVVLNDVIKGGQWYATSGTLTMSGDASRPQVSVDVNAVRVEDRSQVHITGSFHC